MIPFILGSCHRFPQKYLQSDLDGFCFHASRQNLGGAFFDGLVITTSSVSIAGQINNWNILLWNYTKFQTVKQILCRIFTRSIDILCKSG